MKEFLDILNTSYQITDNVSVSLMDILILIVVLFFATIFLRIIRQIITRNLPEDDTQKFKAIFQVISGILN